MAARFTTKLYTFVSGTPVSLYSILGSSGLDEYACNVTVRAGKSNVADVYWLDSASGSRGGYIEPREAVTLDISGHFVSGQHIFFEGTAADTIYITVIG